MKERGKKRRYLNTKKVKEETKQSMHNTYRWKKIYASEFGGGKYLQKHRKRCDSKMKGKQKNTDTVKIDTF